MTGGEHCPRCEAEMRWLHQTWQCGRCRFKLGCCEGEPTCYAPSAEASTTWLGGGAATKTKPP